MGKIDSTKQVLVAFGILVVGSTFSFPLYYQFQAINMKWNLHNKKEGQNQ